MKKFIFCLILTIVVGINGFAQSTKSVNESLKEEIATTITSLVSKIGNYAKSDPASTKYGIVGKTSNKYTINTPIGQFDAKRNEDNSITMFGFTGKVLSSKNNKYTIETNFGKFIVDINKCTITKIS